MIRDNVSTSTRIEWRRGGTITSRKLREPRSWHLGSILEARVWWRRGGEEKERRPAVSEWREEEEGGLGAASRDQTSALSRAAPRSGGSALSDPTPSYWATMRCWAAWVALRMVPIAWRAVQPRRGWARGVG